jgi:hypothetical protein
MRILNKLSLRLSGQIDNINKINIRIFYCIMCNKYRQNTMIDVQALRKQIMFGSYVVF